MFITLEGIDGSGKSTQALKLEEWLKSRLGKGAPLRTMEPGGWPGSEALKAMLLKEKLVHPMSELLLFMADRCEHVKRVLLPALREGKIILCERYQDSTVAYQCWGGGIPQEKIQTLFEYCELPEPDLTLWFDVPVPVAFLRITGRAEGRDRFESESVFLEKVRQGYIEIAKANPKRIVRIDATQNAEAVFNAAVKVIKERLPRG